MSSGTAHRAGRTELVCGGIKTARLAASLLCDRREHQVQQELLYSEDGDKYTGSASTSRQRHSDEAEHECSQGEYAE